MAITVGDVMRHCRNYFQRGSVAGTIVISGSQLQDIPTAPYYGIEGSLYNDGVHASSDTLTNESFIGKAWLLFPPADFVSLCTEIATWAASHPESAYTAESFGGYSYSRATDANGAPISWQTAFAERLKPFKRIITEVDC